MIGNKDLPIQSLGAKGASSTLSISPQSIVVDSNPQTIISSSLAFIFSTAIIGGIISYVLTKSTIINNADNDSAVLNSANADSIISSQVRDRLKKSGLELLAIVSTAIILRSIVGNYISIPATTLQEIRSIRIDMKSYIILTVLLSGITSFQFIHTSSSKAPSSLLLNGGDGSGTDGDKSVSVNPANDQTINISVIMIAFVTVGTIITQTIMGNTNSSIQISVYGYIVLTSIIAGIVSYYLTNKQQLL